MYDIFHGIIMYLLHCFQSIYICVALAGNLQGLPLVAAALFGDTTDVSRPQSVWGCLDMGWRDTEGYWIHPAATDSSLQLASPISQAQSPKMLTVPSAFGCYMARDHLSGKLTNCILWAPPWLSVISPWLLSNQQFTAHGNRKWFYLDAAMYDK